ncbi:MAG TPA: ectonucleotide pyrophosphatase/phosphodiesterase [Polyangiaceae bacterium]|nr:ectonucleotide pyrophosphatase/phosphodiesterase [Polyangiaceae bacterium]
MKHVLVVTIDGLMPDSYVHPGAHGLSVPTLTSLVARGASSDGALSVFPSVTYPSHTSIASGVVPARHGIFTNASFDPLDKNQDAWRWYAEDVRVPRVWDVAYAAGYRTALVDWPVTVGAQATYHVPEFWRAKQPEDVKLIRALSTPGLLDSVSAAYPDFKSGFRAQDVTDQAGTDVAEYLLLHERPHLTFLHIWQVDAAQHHFGLWSDEARAAIENADRQLARLLAAVERAGIASSTVLVVASDHGFANVTRCVNPRFLLRQAGLVTFDAAGKPTAFQADVLSSSGMAYVYLNDPHDAGLESRVRAILDEAKASGTSGIGRIFSRAEVTAAGGDPSAFLGLEPELGTYFGGSRDAYETPPAYKAVHGYDPNRPEMNASLIVFGAGITPMKLEHARLIDVAPTVASLLGLALPGVDGRALAVSRDIDGGKP